LYTIATQKMPTKKLRHFLTFSGMVFDVLHGKNHGDHVHGGSANFDTWFFKRHIGLTIDVSLGLVCRLVGEQS